MLRFWRGLCWDLCWDLGCHLGCQLGCRLGWYVDCHPGSTSGWLGAAGSDAVLVACSGGFSVAAGAVDLPAWLLLFVVANSTLLNLAAAVLLFAVITLCICWLCVGYLLVIYWRLAGYSAAESECFSYQALMKIP